MQSASYYDPTYVMQYELDPIAVMSKGLDVYDPAVESSLFRMDRKLTKTPPAEVVAPPPTPEEIRYTQATGVLALGGDHLRQRGGCSRPLLERGQGSDRFPSEVQPFGPVPVLEPWAGERDGVATRIASKNSAHA